MRVDAVRIAAIARQWPSDLRLVLLYGQDMSASQDMALRIARQFADPGNPVAVEALSGAHLGKDPQALVAAASAMSMFGDRTLVQVDGLEEDGLAAVEGLLSAPPGNPVVAIAGALKKGSKLVALAERSPAVAAMVSYEPALKDATRLIRELGAEFGLKPSREAAIALFESVGGDRALMRREVEKLSLYLDSDETRGRTAELADVAAIGVGQGDSDQFALAMAVAGGRPALVVDLLARMPTARIVALRAVERRLVMLLGLRAIVDGGASPQSAVEGARPPIFWKEKEAVAAELMVWSTPRLSRALGEVLAAERAIKSSGSLGETLADMVLINLARQAGSRR